MHLVITRATRDECKNGKGKKLSIRIYQWSGIAKAVGTKSQENNREYLRNLLVHQEIIWSEGLSRRK